jgi:hypothetical protein
MKKANAPKLQLNKMTLRNLQSEQAARIAGGGASYLCSRVNCPTPFFTNGCNNYTAVASCIGCTHEN